MRYAVAKQAMVNFCWKEAVNAPSPILAYVRILSYYYFVQGIGEQITQENVDFLNQMAEYAYPQHECPFSLVEGKLYNRYLNK
jgi:hypothetical protein